MLYIKNILESLDAYILKIYWIYRHSTTIFAIKLNSQLLSGRNYKLQV